MTFERVRDLVSGVPFMTPDQGRIVYNHILATKPLHCLELGFAHGVSSCYIAAALEELGRGHLTTVDLEPGMHERVPSIEGLLERTGLAAYVSVVREKTSYTWFLKKEIERQSINAQCSTKFDFCYIDGSKNWTIDGLAFFLVDKLLNQRGWILFDDYSWTYGSRSREVTDGINHNALGEDELREPHISRIFELLVMQHPDYGEFRIQDDMWAWAHKVASSSKHVRIQQTYSFKTLVMNGLKKTGLVRP